MARRTVCDVVPSYRNAPPGEFQDESIFDWIRRQCKPIESKAPTSSRTQEPRKEAS